MKGKGRGFTLIELLVVIAIIGMLSSIVLASLNSARTKAQDASRAQNVKALKTAMELYYNANGTYPQVGSQNFGGLVSSLGTFLVPTHIPSIPTILTNDGDQYVWCSSGACASGGDGYGIRVYTVQYGWCNSGVNLNPNWWVSNASSCPF